MSRSTSLDLETFDPRINKTLRQLKKNKEASNINMATKSLGTMPFPQ